MSPGLQTSATLAAPICLLALPAWGAATPPMEHFVCLQTMGGRHCCLLKWKRGVARGKVTVQVREPDFKLQDESDLRENSKWTAKAILFTD